MQIIRIVPLFAIAALLAGQDIRSVQGVVSDGKGRPLDGAVVQIQDMKSLQIRSFVAQNGGKYRFVDLKPDIDYSLIARYHNWWGKKKTLSQFDSRKQAEIDLSVPAAEH